MTQMKPYQCTCNNNESALLSSFPDACQQPNTGRRGFLSGLGSLGAAAGLSGVGAGLLASTGLSANAQTPSAAVGKPYRIDIHHHLYTPNYLVELKKYHGPPAPPWSPQKSLDDMDMNGIATSVLSGPVPGANFNNIELDRRMAREANEYAAQLGRDHPGRFGYFAALPLMDTEGAMKEIEYAMDTLKADGIGLMTGYGDKYLGDQRFWPIWEELNRRRATIYVHPLLANCCKNPSADFIPPAVIEYATDTSRTIASMLYGGAANKFPNINWIWSHSGGTMPFLWSRFTRQELDMKEAAKKVLPNGVLAEVQRFYYDTAQGNHEGAIAALRAIVPTSHILFGSDFPYRSASDEREGLAARNFSPEERMAIDRGNVLRIMPHLKTI